MVSGSDDSSWLDQDMMAMGLWLDDQHKCKCEVENDSFVPSFTDSLFSWSRAVQIRTNLDLVLDWLQGAGLGDIASEFLKKLSVTVNFLCIPKTRLIQVRVWEQTGPMHWICNAMLFTSLTQSHDNELSLCSSVILVKFTGRTFFAKSFPASPPSHSL